MKAILSFVTIASIAICSCVEKNPDSAIDSAQESERKDSSSETINVTRSMFELMDTDSLIKLALKNDTNAYINLNSKFVLQGDYGRQLYYSMLMANQLEFSRAYYDVYSALVLSTPASAEKWLINADSRTRNFALYYLSKSWKLGYKYAKHDVELVTKLFGSLPEPDELLQFGPDVLTR